MTFAIMTNSWESAIKLIETLKECDENVGLQMKKQFSQQHIQKLPNYNRNMEQLIGYFYNYLGEVISYFHKKGYRKLVKTIAIYLQ